MKTNPFFSIIIPTFNRPHQLFLSLKVIMIQNFNDFEVIITDNSDNLKTKKIIDRINDDRIHYFKNKVNIGFVRNLQKGMRKAKGDYVLLHGDDDVMFYNDTLKKTYSFLQKNPYGYVKLNYLYKKHNSFFSFNGKNEKDLFIKPNENPTNIIRFIEKSHAGFISGSFIKNSKAQNITLIDCDVYPWFNMLYEQIKKYGGYFFSGYSFIGAWTTSNFSYYSIRNNRLWTETLLREQLKKLNARDTHQFLREFTLNSIKEFPQIKYYTGNNNLMLYAKRLLEIFPPYKYSVVFWLYYLISIVFPMKSWEMIRYFIHKKNEIKNHSAIQAYYLFEKQIVDNTRES